jgi:predicted transcriptional regulator
MLDKRLIFEIHRLKNMGLKQRQIARELRVGRDTVKKYLKDPEKTFCSNSPRPSKLDPFKDIIVNDPQVKATVIFQHLQGFDGEITIPSETTSERSVEKQSTGSLLYVLSLSLVNRCRLIGGILET